MCEEEKTPPPPLPANRQPSSHCVWQSCRSTPSVPCNPLGSVFPPESAYCRPRDGGPRTTRRLQLRFQTPSPKTSRTDPQPRPRKPSTPKPSMRSPSTLTPQTLNPQSLAAKTLNLESPDSQSTDSQTPKDPATTDTAASTDRPCDGPPTATSTHRPCGGP